MAVIRRLQVIDTIKVGPGSRVLPDGTIVAPVRFQGVAIEFDDGVQVQVERPLTRQSVADAYAAATRASADGIAEGDVFP